MHKRARRHESQIRREIRLTILEISLDKELPHITFNWLSEGPKESLAAIFFYSQDVYLNKNTLTVHLRDFIVNYVKIWQAVIEIIGEDKVFFSPEVKKVIANINATREGLKFPREYLEVNLIEENLE